MLDRSEEDNSYKNNMDLITEAVRENHIEELRTLLPLHLSKIAERLKQIKDEGNKFKDLLKYCEECSSFMGNVFQLAISKGDVLSVSELLNHDANICNEFSTLGNTLLSFKEALKVALEHNHLDMIPIFLPILLPKISLYELKEAFDAGITHGSPEVVKIILEQHGKDFGSSALNKALIKAASKGHADVASLLIEAGADINYYDIMGQTAFIFAVCNNHIHMVETLLKNPKVEVNFQDQYLRTALMQAAALGYVDIINMLLLNDRVDPLFQNQRGMTALMEAAFHNQAGAVKTLLESKRDVGRDWDANDGRSALMQASIQGHIDVAKVFLSDLAAITHANKKGLTAFMCAAKYGHIAIAQLFWENIPLAERIAMINHEDNEGNTALMLAAKSGHTNMVTFLLEKGADINYKNKEGVTAFMSAAAGCTANSCQIMELFLEKTKSTAMVHEQTENGNTALMLVASHPFAKKEVVRFLLEKGAIITHQNKRGQTALQLARGEILGILEAALAKQEEKFVQQSSPGRLGIYGATTSTIQQGSRVSEPSKKSNCSCM